MNVVEIHDRRPRKAFRLSNSSFLGNAPYCRCDFSDDDFVQISVRGSPGQEKNGPPADRVREICPPDIELFHLRLRVLPVFRRGSQTPAFKYVDSESGWRR